MLQVNLRLRGIRETVPPFLRLGFRARVHRQTRAILALIGRENLTRCYRAIILAVLTVAHTAVRAMNLSIVPIFHRKAFVAVGVSFSCKSNSTNRTVESS